MNRLIRLLRSLEVVTIAVTIAVVGGVYVVTAQSDDETDLPNPPNGVCYIVGENVVEGEPTFANADPKIVEFRLFEICGELHPGTGVGQFVQRDEFKTLILTDDQARLILRAAEDWIDAGLVPE